MKKFFFAAFVITASMLTVISCKNNPHVDDVTNTIVLPAAGPSVVQASNQFAFNLLHAALLQDSASHNKLISPLSIYLALSMVYNGAGSATKDSMAATLQLAGINIADLNDVCKSLITQLPAEDNKVQFSIANSIWYNKDSFQPLPSFSDLLQNYYKASANPLTFDAAAAGTINNWVKQETNNKIPSIIDAVSPDDLMYLINAIYFNGAWQHAFKPADTHNDMFYLQDGSTTSVPFMQQQATVNLYADSLFSIIELPYGGGKSYSMYIAVPASQQLSINTFAMMMNNSLIENASSKMYNASIQLAIPKWEYSDAINDMIPVLSSLGMGIAFGDSADLSAMYDASQTKPFITRAIHKTYIKVNEEGTEAAAATAISIGTTTALPYIFKANRPFLYTIVEKQTGTILFTGIVTNPGE